MNNVRNIRYRRGVRQAIAVPRDLPLEVRPWANSVVREINNLRDDVERLRKLTDEKSFRKQQEFICLQIHWQESMRTGNGS